VTELNSTLFHIQIRFVERQRLDQACVSFEDLVSSRVRPSPITNSFGASAQG
jgi:hypothetical protein